MYQTNFAIKRCPPPFLAVVLVSGLARKCLIFVTEYIKGNFIG